jgi:hypothetical protein
LPRRCVFAPARYPIAPTDLISPVSIPDNRKRYFASNGVPCRAIVYVLPDMTYSMMWRVRFLMAACQQWQTRAELKRPPCSIQRPSSTTREKAHSLYQRRRDVEPAEP